MPKKGKVGFISTVKPFYDKSKLTARILLAKDLRELNFLLVRNIFFVPLTDKSRQYSKTRERVFGEDLLPRKFFNRDKQ